MFIKKFLIFAIFCFYGNNCLAEYITFDSAALDTAMNEITSLGKDSPYKTVEEAGDALYDAFYAAKKGNTVDSDKVMDECYNKIIKSGRICNRFIITYNSYLDHANFCFKANNFSQPEWNGHIYSFQDCFTRTDSKHYVNGKADFDTGYSGDSAFGKCVQWVDAAERCQKYLISYYQDKLNEQNLTAANKKRYECILEKLQTGNMDIPTSKIEKACN